MKEQFVSFEIALRLKEFGFDEECLMWYSKDGVQLINTPNNNTVKWLKSNELNTCSAPLYQQVFDWLRKEYNLHCEISLSGDEDNRYTYRVYQTTYPHITYLRGEEGTYKEMREDCIKYLLKILKQL